VNPVARDDARQTSAAGGEPLRALGLTLRAEADTDGPFMLDLYRSVRAEELALAPWTPAQKDAFLADQLRLQRADWSQRFARADRWVIEHDARPIGRLYLDRASAGWRLIDIGLMKEARDRGFGRALLGWIQAEAARARVEAVVLLVLVHNPAAARLYRRFGFVDDGPPDGPYRAMTWRVAG